MKDWKQLTFKQRKVISNGIATPKDAFIKVFDEEFIGKETRSSETAISLKNENNSPILVCSKFRFDYKKPELI